MAALALALALVGCGQPSSGTTQLRERFARKLPAGWQIGTAKEAGFPVLPPTKDTDLVVWRQQPVMLDWRKEPVSTQLVAHVYFTLGLVDWIVPTEFPAIYKANEALRKQHIHHQSRLLNIPRDETGKLMPRGAAEAREMQSVLEDLATLAPVRQHLPTHYTGQIGLQLHDWRTTLVPVEREVQQEQNRVYAMFNELLTRYPTR